MKYNCSVVVYAVGEYCNITLWTKKAVMKANEGVYNKTYFNILFGSE